MLLFYFDDAKVRQIIDICKFFMLKNVYIVSRETFGKDYSIPKYLCTSVKEVDVLTTISQ